MNARSGNRIAFLLAAALTLTGGVAYVAAAARETRARADTHASLGIPPGYRDWTLISVAREEGDLDDIRAILGNDLAVKACREGTPLFPDGAVIARIAWSCVPSEENNEVLGRRQSFVAGLPKNGVQFMFKDSRKYAATGGWAFTQFDDGRPADASMLEACFSCHALTKERDLVFTRYAH
jgi:hypothetical protein